jgi:hypothetical protein
VCLHSGIIPPARTESGPLVPAPLQKSAHLTIISGVWALAFAAMVLAEVTVLFAPQIPRRLGIIVIVLALVGAVKFTAWYPQQVRRHG